MMIFEPLDWRGGTRADRHRAALLAMLRARIVRHSQHDAEGYGAKCDVTGPLAAGCSAQRNQRDDPMFNF